MRETEKKAFISIWKCRHLIHSYVNIYYYKFIDTRMTLYDNNGNQKIMLFRILNWEIRNVYAFQKIFRKKVSNYRRLHANKYYFNRSQQYSRCDLMFFMLISVTLWWVWIKNNIENLVYNSKHFSIVLHNDQILWKLQ